MLPTVLILFLMIPFQALQASVVAFQLRPIMNDTWFSSLQEIKEKSPADSLVFSWWPPGYFIISIAERRVLADGGSQHLPQTYWTARAFLAEDEQETLGILRMLTASGNDATAFLVDGQGMTTARAVDLISHLVTLTRPEADRYLSAHFSAAVRERLVRLTHGERLSPAYVFLYNDLMDQNAALSLMSMWDFHKAEKMNQAEQSARLPFFSSKGSGARSYLDKVLEVTGGIQRYTPEARLMRRENGELYFANGLRVNLDTLDSRVYFPGKGERSPFSLFYMKDGHLVEKMNEGERIEASALLIEHDQQFTSVLADRRLIRSSLFRWYYLNGQGMRAFKPFSIHQDSLSQTRIQVLEVIWP